MNEAAINEAIFAAQQRIFALYALELDGSARGAFVPGGRELAQGLRRLLAECGLALDEENFYAALMRVLDLNTSLFKAACKRAGVDEAAVRPLVDEFVKKFHEAEQNRLISELKTALAAQTPTPRQNPVFLQNREEIPTPSENPVFLQKATDEGSFKIALLELVDTVGKQLNICAPKWLEKIEANARFFSQLDEPFAYIKAHDLLYYNERGEAAECVYALACGLESGQPKLVPYAEYFAAEFGQIALAFERFFAQTAAHESAEQIAWKSYLRALKAAMLSTEFSTAPWAAAERAWMQVKDSWQIGHFLEYYEDAYTHAVALEWDLRVNLPRGMKEERFKKLTAAAMQKAYALASVDAPQTLEAMQQNLERAQIYISSPILYYGASIYGLFSAQVVPNNELVSAECGKKIFAFVEFVRQKALNKPKTLLNDFVFSAEINAHNDALNASSKDFRQVYEITTIGHEGGHMYFIAPDTEQAMNGSGRFKNIEEFKATAGGIFAFLQQRSSEELKRAVLINTACRAVRLLAFSREQEIEPYYCEALIFLKILKASGVLKINESFNEQNAAAAPLVQINAGEFEGFKEEFLHVYKKLARHYLQKQDAQEFLSEFAKKQEEIFISCDAQIEYLRAKYEQLYEKYASAKKH